jgi:MFS family permease
MTFNKKKILWWPLLMVGVASLFYVYEFFLRIIPSSITMELMRDFQLNSASVSVLAACFFYAYAPMQIPAGYVCDKIGPRLAITLAVFTCSMATFWFAQTHSFSSACLTRLLIGAASSMAFIGPLTLSAQWIPKKYYAFIAGTIQLMGCLGAIFAGKPVVILQQAIGWRTMTMYAGGIGIIITILCFMIIRNHTSQQQIKNHQPIRFKEHCKQLFHNKQVLFIAICGFATWGPIAIFGELWGPSFLISHYHLPEQQAAGLMKYIWIGVAIGSPAMGWLSDFIRSRKIPLYICFSMSLMSTLMIIFVQLSHLSLICWLTILGLSAAAQPITFALMKDHVSSRVIGTATGFQNMAVITGGVILQPLTGYILHLTWNHQYLHGIPHYGSEQFQLALILMPICALIGLSITYRKIQESLTK